MINFKNIDYLRSGTERQQTAYRELKELKIFEILKEFNPILTGTIPIDIDIPKSDLDIICECNNHSEFSNLLHLEFANQNNFEIKSYFSRGLETTIARFVSNTFHIEIFGQNTPTNRQFAYRHLIIENKILEEKGEIFRSKIRKLKAEGVKTEPAFAKLLGLKGDPYEELLNFKI